MTEQATTSEKNQVPVDELTYRQAASELDGIIAALEGNTMELEDTLAAYERGVALVRSMRERLDSAQQKVEVLMGNLETDATDEEIDTTLHKA